MHRLVESVVYFCNLSAVGFRKQLTTQKRITVALQKAPSPPSVRVTASQQVWSIATASEESLQHFSNWTFWLGAGGHTDTLHHKGSYATQHLCVRGCVSSKAENVLERSSFEQSVLWWVQLKKWPWLLVLLRRCLSCLHAAEALGKCSVCVSVCTVIVCKLFTDWSPLLSCVHVP